MKNSNPAEYHRNSKDWSQYLGRIGTVIQAITVRVSAPELESFLPYDYLIVQLLDEHSPGETKKRLELMGVTGTHFQVGDTVRLVFKKVAQPAQAEIIPYGIKAELVSDLEK